MLNDVKSVEFDDFYNLVKERNPTISADTLRTVLKQLKTVHSVTDGKILFKPDTPSDQDSVDDMADKVSTMADQEAMSGIKAEL